MNPKTFPVLLASAAALSLAFFLNRATAPRTAPSSISTPHPVAPEVGRARTMTFTGDSEKRPANSDSRSTSLSSSPANTKSQANDRSPAKSFNPTVEARPQSWPIAFQSFDVQASGLSPMQIQVLDSLRQDFIREVGGTKQDPSDPAYAKRWSQLKPRYDEQLRAYFGDTFVEQLSRLAADNESHAAAPK